MLKFNILKSKIPHIFYSLLVGSVIISGTNIEAIAQVNLNSPQQLAQRNSTINGTLDSNSNSLENGTYFNLHTFEGMAGEKLTIDLTSSEFDPSLVLLDSDNKTIADNNDGGEGNNSRIVITLPETGTYTLGILAIKPGELGNYSLSFREATPEDFRLAEAEDLNIQALQLYQQGKYDEARSKAQQSLGIREEILEPKHPDIAQSLNTLGLLYNSQGNYSKTEALYQRALAIREEIFGEKHPHTAISLNNLGNLYSTQGNYSKAEPLFQRALAIQEEVLGEKHSLTAKTLNNLAELYSKQGNYSGAEPLYKRVLAIFEEVLPENHYLTAQSLNNLAELYRTQRNYSKAEPLYLRALAIFEEVLPENHHLTATTLNNLGVLYSSQGNYSKAEPLYLRALGIREEIFGEKHPHTAISLNNLGDLYREQGNYSEAEYLFQRALTINEEVLGAEHPQTTSYLSNLSGLYLVQNNIPLALKYLTRSTDIEEKNLSAFLTTIGSEARKTAYLNSLFGTTYWTISLHLQNAPDNQEAARLAMTTILRRKGRILDSLGNIVQNIRQRLNPEDKALLDKISEKRTQLSNLVFEKSETIPLQQYQEQLTTLETEIQTLETSLSNRNSQFAKELKPVTMEAVQKAMPDDTVLIEFIVYRLGNTKTLELEELRYAAYILHPNGEPKAIDLGEAEIIDEKIQSLLLISSSQPSSNIQKLQRQISRFKEIAREVDELVMKPLRPLLKDKEHIFISPDGLLNRIPFAALVDENGDYLVENYLFTNLTSGRDLIKLQESAPSRSNSLIVANPDYNFVSQNNNAPLTASSILGKDRRSADLDQLNCCTPLPGTAAEAEAIKPLLPNARIFTEGEAIDEVIKAAEAPKILHIATHGFFLPDQEIENPTKFDNNSRQPVRNENPLLRSGLIFAGFNTPEGKQQGLLTGLEASSLDLWGTKLVVLSACETGLGDVHNGEGVYGLRRAFVLAGAETLLMSLWSVSDQGTKDLMTNYYQLIIKENVDRSLALRQTQLSMLNNPEYEHPFFWSAFVLSGDWRKLE